MIGDNIIVKNHHMPPAGKILDRVGKRLENRTGVFVFTVGGESGSGKSTLSLAMKTLLEERGNKTFIFHMDDYFRYPPQDNHQKRLEDISWVGPGEVNLELLQEHVDKVKEGTGMLRKPLVHYRENLIREVIVEMDDIGVVIVEGTYTTLLENIDCKVFMLRNYIDTYEARVRRGRDQLIPFNEKVLEIEHEIIHKHADLADILIDKNYNVIVQTKKGSEDRVGGDEKQED